MKTKLHYLRKDAFFSKCGKHRYWLFRQWDAEKPKIQFIGLNPSTANAESDDATIRNIVRISNALGYGGLYMTNCFSIISSDPDILKSVPLDGDEQVENKHSLLSVARDCTATVFAWGGFAAVKETGMDSMLAGIFPNAQALGFNADGSPFHPRRLTYIKGALDNPALYKYSTGNV